MKMKEKTKKLYNSLVVASALQPILMCKDFGDLHDLFDHFCPGVMQLGICAAMPMVKAEIKKQQPEFAEFVDMLSIRGNNDDEPNFQAASKWISKLFPQKLALTGPLDATEEDIRQAFDDLAARR